MKTEVLIQLEKVKPWLSVAGVRRAVTEGNWQEAFSLMLTEANRAEAEVLDRTEKLIYLEMLGEECGIEVRGNCWPLEDYYSTVYDANAAWRILDALTRAMNAEDDLAKVGGDTE